MNPKLKLSVDISGATPDQQAKINELVGELVDKVATLFKRIDFDIENNCVKQHTEKPKYTIKL